MKNVLLACLFMLITVSLSAQLSLRGGINYSNVSVDGTDVDLGDKNKFGFHAGLQTNFDLGGLSLRPALLYQLKGGKAEVLGTTTSTHLHYLEIPINLGARIGSDEVGIIVEAGPYLGYLINTSSDVPDIGDRFDKIDLGINFGAVLELDLISIGANYSNSLSNISKETIPEGFKTKNGNLALFVLFNL